MSAQVAGSGTLDMAPNRPACSLLTPARAAGPEAPARLSRASEDAHCSCRLSVRLRNFAPQNASLNSDGIPRWRRGLNNPTTPWSCSPDKRVFSRRPMKISQYFSASYAEARQKFLEAAGCGGAEIHVNNNARGQRARSLPSTSPGSAPCMRRICDNWLYARGLASGLGMESPLARAIKRKCATLSTSIPTSGKRFSPAPPTSR